MEQQQFAEATGCLQHLQHFGKFEGKNILSMSHDGYIDPEPLTQSEFETHKEYLSGFFSEDENKNILCSSLQGGVQVGKFERLSYFELLEKLYCFPANEDIVGFVTVKNIIGDSRGLHSQPEFEGSVFQMASQFNFKEEVSPDVKLPPSVLPLDMTQGPACALACYPAYVHRWFFRNDDENHGLVEICNYFEDKLGDKMIDVKNGYVESSNERLDVLYDFLQINQVSEFVKDNLRVGVQWNTQVTDVKSQFLVTQVCCSALSIGYSKCTHAKWKTLARLILYATYRMTLLVGLVNNAIRLSRGERCKPVLLTAVGGGVFKNSNTDILWGINTAIADISKIATERHIPLDILLVHFRSINPELQI
jgi:hypothetical protein